MIKIGAVNIDTSHPKGFSDYLLKGKRAKYVAVYNDGFRNDAEVNEFIQNQGLEKRCQSLDELAEIVDIGFIHDCNWHKHLDHAMPFIKRGKPVFIDKPIVGFEADCRRIEELVSKGAIIFGSSSVRYCRELQSFMQKPETERGALVHVYAATGADEFNYAMHMVEGIGVLAGTGALSCRWFSGNKIGGQRCDTYSVRFSNGPVAVYTTCCGVWRPFDYIITTTKTTYAIRVDSSRLYAALLDTICDSLENKRPGLAPINALTESVRIMLAGRISKEGGGIDVRLADIPPTDPGYDGDAFERSYMANARKK